MLHPLYFLLLWFDCFLQFLDLVFQHKPVLFQFLYLCVCWGGVGSGGVDSLCVLGWQWLAGVDSSCVWVFIVIKVFIWV